MAFIIRLAFIIYQIFLTHFNIGEGWLYLNLSSNLASGKGLSVDSSLLMAKSAKDVSASTILSSWQQLNALYGIVVFGHPTAYVMPLYPLLLAGLRFLFITPVLPGQILGAILGSGLVYLLGRIAWHLAGHAAGVATAVLAAIHPHFVYFSWTLTPQVGFDLCMAGAILLFLAWREHGGWGRILGMGVLVGLGWLLRTEGLELLLALVVVAIFPTRWAIPWLKRLSGAILLVLVGFVMVLPWGLRNQAELGRFVLTTTTSGRILYEYNLLPFASEFALEPPVEQEYFSQLRQEALPGLTHPEWASFPAFSPQTLELLRNDMLTDQALRFITTNPGVYIKLCLMRLGDFFRLTQRFQAGMIVQISTMIFVPLMLILGLLGLVRRVKGTLPLVVLVAGFFAAMVLIAGGVAYRATTFDVAWMPLAGMGAAWIYEAIWGKKRKKT